MSLPGKRLNTSQSEGNLSINSRISDKRREKLINLKRREDLKDALEEKFKGRFGHGAQDRAADEVSVASSTIRKEVDNFAKMANVTEANLGRLERRLQHEAVRKGPGEGSVISAYSGASQRSRSIASLTGQNVISGAGGPQGQQSYDWRRLDEYASYLHEQDALRQRLGVHALQKKLRMDLDGQVNEKKKKQMEADEEDRIYHANSMQDLERWKAMEQAREEEKHQKIMREKADRDAQLDFERKLKNEATQKKKEEEASLVEKIVSEMEQEQRRFEKKKEQTKKAMRKVFEENQKDQERRNAETKQQMAREAEAIKEYTLAMDKQEEDRNAEMQARLEKQNTLMKQLQANVDGIKKGAGDNDAQRAAAQQDEMDRHFFEAENMKQTRLKQMRLENQSYLLKQMEEKAGRKADEKELTMIQAHILGKDTEEYNEIEKAKVTNRRAMLVEHRKDIERQMESKLKQAVPVMSEHEVAMNRPLLNLVNRTLQQRDDTMPMGMDVMEDDYEDE